MAQEKAVKKEDKKTEEIKETKTTEGATKATKLETKNIKEVETINEEKVTKITEEKPAEQKEKEAVKPEKPEEKKTLEKVYTIPLGDVYKQPWSKRAKKAVRMVREFLERHTKKEVKIAGDVNEAIWSRGMKHPPRKIRVNVEIEDNIATARLLK